MFFVFLESVPKLVQSIHDTSISRGEQFNLTCIFSGQPEIQLAWYQDGLYLPTNSRINTQYIVTNTTVRSILLFKRLKSSENNVAYSCRAHYPNLTKLYTQSAAVLNISGINCCSCLLLIAFLFLEQLTHLFPMHPFS